jgi:alkylation response protein AidB-like acyl-CoA dehydrogenase
MVAQRWMIAACALGMQRLVVEECLKYVRRFCFFIPVLTPGRWSNQRIAFGKPLHAQAVVRAKLAGMISRVESSQNWLESVTYQMNNVRPQPTHTK